jgi:hypothetical protein
MYIGERGSRRGLLSYCKENNSPRGEEMPTLSPLSVRSHRLLSMAKKQKRRIPSTPFRVLVL